MPRQFALFAAASVALVFAGCGEQTQEQKNEALRADIKEKKKAEAAANYKLLVEKFPGNEHAPEAQRKAAELGAKK